ncbi:MAG TPA: hypothetical protein PK329_05985 [Myxococcota bacterium]|nr:hypothetical protein [Myxococcota bacterium]HOS61667.1 hypothetical protein [Myxococcota bacterium]HPL24900.1 hypothetical protein [Myxococcota bacterium]HQI61493.1 hypothetical protein [Myxococcota bacterium]
MRKVSTKTPSFPEVTFNKPLNIPDDERWNELCGDLGHWRVGAYSPEGGSLADVQELELHTCPELFLLISGAVTLVLSDMKGGVIEMPLEPMKPVLVTAPHSAYCPDGPYSGTCFVVERDEFDTEYRPPKQWV